MSLETQAPDPGGAIDYEAFQSQIPFQSYKRRFRRFAFPLTVGFMLWFLFVILLAAFAHDFMARPFLGLNVGLWLGLSQFVSTFAITTWYVSFANKTLDPATTELRAELQTLEAEAVTADNGTEVGNR